MPPVDSQGMTSKFWATTVGAGPVELLTDATPAQRSLVVTGAALMDASVADGTRVSVWIQLPDAAKHGAAQKREAGRLVLCNLVGGRCTFVKLDVVLDRPVVMRVTGGHAVTLHGMEMGACGGAAGIRATAGSAERAGGKVAPRSAGGKDKERRGKDGTRAREDSALHGDDEASRKPRKQHAGATPASCTPRAEPHGKLAETAARTANAAAEALPGARAAKATVPPAAAEGGKAGAEPAGGGKKPGAVQQLVLGVKSELIRAGSGRQARRGHQVRARLLV